LTYHAVSSLASALVGVAVGEEETMFLIHKALSRNRGASLATAIWMAACSTTENGTQPAASLATATAIDKTGAAAGSGAATAGPAIDPTAVAMATGGTPEVSGPVVKVSFPRADMPISIDGWDNVPPFVGLTSYAAFTPASGMGNNVMVMGDTVLLEDEVNPVMSAALTAGLAVTALHNHFFFDKPHVYFMHIGGVGTVEVLGAAVKAMLDAQKVVRQQTPQPATSFGVAAPAIPSQLDAAKLDPVVGVQGTLKDGMYKASFGRTITSTMCGGCSIGAAMGLYTWAAFAGSDDNASVDGDFAVAEDELQPVLMSLRAAGINIVSIHHHIMDGSTRILFLHYWGRGSAIDLATKVKTAVDLTAWDGRRNQ
jgi:hypothetical protein